MTATDELKAERETLLAAAKAADGIGSNDTPAIADPKVGEREPSKPSDEVEKDGTKGKTTDDPKAKADVSKDGKPAEPSRYEKAKQREAEAWKRIEEEKKAVAKRDAELKAEAEKIQAERLKLDEERKKPSRTPEQLEQIAKDLEEEGRPEVAKLAREEAEALRSSQKNEVIEAKKKQFVEEWNANYRKEVEANPALKDPNSDIFKRVDAMLKENPVLFTYAKGINDAVKYQKALINGEKAETLEKQLAELTAKLAEKEKLLTPGNGNPASPSGGEKSFEQMTHEEQRNELLRKSQEADRRG